MNKVVKHLTRLEVNILKNRNKLLKSKVKVLKEEGVDFLVIANATGLSKNEIAML